jgi:predicted RNA binding protein YcfA (HicA-like mRNA interferase family)
MPPLPVVSGEECVRALCRLGYRVVRQKGSHVRLACSGRPPVTVPMHASLDRGTLRSILRHSEVTVETFIDLLD